MPSQNIEQMLHDAAWLGRTPGLQRITALLNRLDNPQNKLKFVHIAGTNGKGSTAAMVSSILTAAGYKTALFTSPHLTHLGERFKIDGVEIGSDDLERVADQVLTVSQDIQPTEFELMTAMGLVYFTQQHCDIVVLEVGLGGTLDSTNVIPPPVVAAITNIGLDHTAILGDNLPTIAREKAGILKAGSRCVLYHQTDEVMEEVETICKEKAIPLTITQPDQLIPLEISIDGQRFRYRDLEFEIPLLGGHQLENALVALEIVDALQREGWEISQDSVRLGLQRTQWAGRMEVLSRSPDFIVDGGHNPQCLEALMAGLKALYTHKKLLFLMGILGDKDVDQMVNLVLPLAQEVVTITPDSPRALSARDLAEEFRSRDIPATPACSVEEGVSLVRQLAEPDDVICAFGSLYIVGEIRGLMK